MKIAHYINNLGSGGAEKLLTDILPMMAKNGNEVDLIVSNNIKSVEKFISILKNENIKIYNLNTSFYNPFQVFYLLQLLKKNKYDIVHAHLFPTQYWLAFVAIFSPEKTKFVKTEHSVFNERKNHFYLKPVEVFVYKKYHKIIGITLEVTNNLVKWLGSKENMITIYNGVNLKQIETAKSQNSTDYSFIDKKNFNILMVGRFDGIHKDQMNLIKSLKFLSPNTMIFFAGEGPSFNKIQVQTNELGFRNQVSFIGVRNDVYKLMSLVDLNVLSSNAEGFSGVALESLASGKPFIGSDVVGINDVVPDAGFLFSPNDPKILANKINEIKNDVKEQLRNVTVALTHVQKFDISLMVSQYLNIYKDITGLN